MDPILRLSSDEITKIAEQDNMPLFCLNVCSHLLGTAHSQGLISEYYSAHMDRSITALVEALGVCLHRGLTYVWLVMSHIIP